MTTLATHASGPIPSRPGSSHPTARRVAVHPPTFGRLVAAEWVKFRSLRSSWWTLAVGVLLFPVLAAMRIMSIAQVPEAVGSPGQVGAVYVTSAVVLSQLAMCTLGVLAITGEYGTGQIRSTLAAAPTRVPALVAKLLVTVLAVMAASLVGLLLAWAAAAPWFEVTGMSVNLLRAEDARIMLGVPLYLGAATALAYGIGAIVRSSAGGVAIILGLLLVIENAVASIPWAPLQTLAVYLPAGAGGRLIQSDAFGSVTTVSSTTTLGPWAGYGVMLVWVAALVIVAAVLLRRRDA